MKGVKVSDQAPSDVYAGSGSNVVKEAKAKKHGGKAMGDKSMSRADRAPRKSGGRTGSNMNPLSSAHHGMAPKGRAGLEMN
jgi:hypothetical protein